jgi:hypothetical protein
MLEDGHSRCERVRIVFQWTILPVAISASSTRRGNWLYSCPSSFQTPEVHPSASRTPHRSPGTGRATSQTRAFSDGTHAGAAFPTDDQPVNARRTCGHSIRLLGRSRSINTTRDDDGAAANGRCGLGEGTFATTRGKGRVAPNPDTRGGEVPRTGSTYPKNRNCLDRPHRRWRPFYRCLSRSKARLWAGNRWESGECRLDR